MLVTDLKSNRLGNLDDIFYDTLPDTCPEQDCGFPLEILETLTQLRCSNPRCPAKIEQRSLALLTQLGVKGFGEAYIGRLVRYYHLESPLQLFSYNPEEDGIPEGIPEEACKKLYTGLQAKNNFTLAEYVRIANIPGVQTCANSLFGQYDDLDLAYRAIEEGGINYVKRCLGTEADVRAINVYNSLMQYKLDLTFCIEYVNIIRVNGIGGIYKKACVTGDVGFEYKTKAQYYALINGISPNCHVDFLNSVTKDVDYVIWSGGSLTGKIRKAMSMQEKGIDIRILNAKEFEKEIRSLVGE